MADLVIIVVVAVLLGAAIRYIIKEKKKGTRCIGCPAAGTCSSKGSGTSASCSCSIDDDETDKIIKNLKEK